MNRRNWLQIDRKLIDGTDFDYSFNAVQKYMAENNLAFFGSGVLITTVYPSPFPVSVSETTMTGAVGQGIAYDPTGLQTRIDDATGTFTVLPGDAAFDRRDLLVIRYKSAGDTLIPEPDTPTSNVYLNIHDGFELAVIPGTPSGSPTYPTKGQYDVILAGLTVQAGATQGDGVDVDLSVREVATPLRTFFPEFEQETLAGAVDGSNQVFTLSKTPYDQSSVVVSVNGLALHSSEWTLSGQTVQLLEAPAPGQDVYAYYVVNAAGTLNPVSGFQEVPTGTIDGTNNTFTLSNQPVDQKSMQVFIDGILVPITGWSLTQNPLGSSISFTAGNVPQPGQDVYAFYLLNSVSVANAANVPSSGGGTGGGGANLATEYPQLSATDISNGYVTLGHTPTSPSVVLLDLIGGSAQAYGADFTVTGNKLYWIGDLGALISASDRFRIHYAY